MVNYDWFRKFLADELFTAHVELNRRNLEQVDRKSTRLNSSHSQQSRMPSSA